MTKPNATWQDLPFHFKQNVVKLLDFDSRCSLQLCSKSDDCLIRNSPFIIQLFQVTLTINDPNLAQLTACFDQSSGYRHKTQNLEATCATFLSIISNKNTFCKKFQIGFNAGTNLSHADQYDLMQRMLESEFQINCEMFCIWTVSSDQNAYNDQKCLTWKFLQRINPKYLEKLQISLPLSKIELKKIIKSEQFKKLKMINLEQFHDTLRIKDMFGAEEFRCEIQKMTADETWDLVQNFLDKPDGSFFTVYTRNELNLTEILRKFGERYEPRDVQNKYEVLHTKRIKMKTNKRSFLVLEFLMNTVRGHVRH